MNNIPQRAMRASTDAQGVAKSEASDNGSAVPPRSTASLPAGGPRLITPAPKSEGKSILQSIRTWVTGNFGQNHNLREALEEAMEEVIEEHEESGRSSFNPEEKQMLQNLLEFGELEVEDVMIHRVEVDAVPEDITLPDLRAHVLEKGHSRIPVYRGTMDEVVGLILTKDLIRFIGSTEDFHLKSLLRPMLAVPPSMKVVDLLVKMRMTGSHMALVVDEYGGTDGIVTLEDLFEAIVGDIQDEHDEEEEAELTWLAPREAMVDARMELDELEEAIGFSLRDEEEEEEFDTLGGLVCSLFGYVPRVEEVIEHKGVAFRIEEADARRVHKVKLVMVASVRDEEE